MNEPDISLWLEAKHWGDLLRHHLDPDDQGLAVDEPYDFGWECPVECRIPWSHERLDDIRDGSLGAVWLGDVSIGLSDRIQQWWPKLQVGAYIGGPSFGWGFVPGDRFAVNSRGEIEHAVSRLDDISEIFTGSEGNPCWFAFKSSDRERLLLLSGADQRHTDAYGYQNQANHRAYCARQGYDYRWLVWEKELPRSVYRQRSPVWGKIHAMISAIGLGEYSQVWWIDGDAVFLRFDRALHRFLHPGWSSVHPEFSDGGVMVSTGVWGAREAELEGLKDVWGNDRHGFGFYSEELAWGDSIRENPSLWTRAQLVDHRIFNSVPLKGFAYHDPADNFVLHLAGSDNELRRRVFTEVNRVLSLDTSENEGGYIPAGDSPVR